MLIVEVDVVHLEVGEGFFAGLPYVFGLSVDSKIFSIEEGPEFSANEHFAPETGILEHRSQELLVRPLISLSRN